MKKNDIIVLAGFILFFLPFFLFRHLYDFYYKTNLEHPFLMSYIKFALLATFGEALGLRIREGVYNKPGLVCLAGHLSGASSEYLLKLPSLFLERLLLNCLIHSALMCPKIY